jgi:hypothetical protein
MGPESAYLAYAQSHGFIDYLARNHGERRLREWVAAVLRGDDFERATRRSFRTDLGVLDARFRAEWEPQAEE